MDRVKDACVRASRNPTHEVALAVSLGIGAGLIPKANLIAVVLLVLLFLLRLNLMVGLTTLGITSVISYLLDPDMHFLGDHMLATAALQPAFIAVLRVPWGPWTAINNTVVCGSLLVAIVQALPTYILTRTLLARQSQRFQDHWFTRSLGLGPRAGWRI